MLKDSNASGQLPLAESDRILSRVVGAPAYPQAGVIARLTKFLLLTEHYWLWTKVHFRQGGPKAVANRARRRLKLLLGLDSSKDPGRSLMHAPSPPQSPRDCAETYREVVERLFEDYSEEKAMSLAVGGNFEQTGVLMRQILLDAGLKPEHYLIDVGCGSGRLAHMLNVARYLGTDIVPVLIEYARTICSRPSWRFELVADIAIPEEDGQADLVCFFSVFTHLLHEDAYRYLREAYRVLKPEGKVVFSFLDFRIGCQWGIFEDMIKIRERGALAHHNQFMSRDGVETWARHLGFKIEAIYDGDIPHIRVCAPMTMEDGHVVTEMTSLGQSVCVLGK